jgi:hypothetical protein
MAFYQGYNTLCLGTIGRTIGCERAQNSEPSIGDTVFYRGPRAFALASEGLQTSSNKAS